jgi:uncharacterized membrane protein
MKSKAAIGNHPIHPMLVPIPIGAFFLAFVGDLLHAATPKDPFWYDLSFTCLGIGLIFGVLAAVFGAIDYLSVSMSSRAFRLATWHAVLNALALVSLAATFIVRRHGGASQGPLWSWAFGLLLVGFALLAGAGWLGGKLAYEHRVGVVEEPPAPLAPPARTAVSAAVPGPREAAGKPVANRIRQGAKQKPVLSPAASSRPFRER